MTCNVSSNATYLASMSAPDYQHLAHVGSHQFPLLYSSVHSLTGHDYSGEGGDQGCK